MKGRVMEKTAALICALVLAAGVMSGGVLAKGKELAAQSAARKVLTSETKQEAYVVVSPIDYTPAEVTDNRDMIPLYVNGVEAGACRMFGGVPCADAEGFFRALGYEVSGERSGDVFSLWGDVELTAGDGDLYFVCNGRYLLAEEGVHLADGQALLPVEALAKCAGLTAAWDHAAWTVEVAGRPSLLPAGEIYYEATDVYWLSRIIYAEAGTAPLEAQIAVGDVILNRVDSDSFPGENNVYDVIFAKNAFDVVINGMIYMEPDESSVIAAKLALEGYDLVGRALYYDTVEYGGGYTCVARIGGFCFMTEA